LVKSFSIEYNFVLLLRSNSGIAVKCRAGGKANGVSEDL